MPRPSRKDKVLEAAKRLFIRRGYHGTSLRCIADECEMTMGAIYHHFKSKEQLYLAVLNRYSLLSHLEEVVDKVVDPNFPLNLAEFGMALWRVARQHKDFFKLAYVDILEFGGRNVKPIVTGTRLALESAVLERIEDRIADGRLAPLNPEVLLRCVTDTFLHYYLEEMMLDESLSESSGLSQEQVAQQLAAILLRGIMGRRTAQGEANGHKNHTGP